MGKLLAAVWGRSRTVPSAPEDGARRAPVTTAGGMSRLGTFGVQSVSNGDGDQLAHGVPLWAGFAPRLLAPSSSPTQQRKAASGPCAPRVPGSAGPFQSSACLPSVTGNEGPGVVAQADVQDIGEQAGGMLDGRQEERAMWRPTTRLIQARSWASAGGSRRTVDGRLGRAKSCGGDLRGRAAERWVEKKANGRSTGAVEIMLRSRADGSRRCSVAGVVVEGEQATRHALPQGTSLGRFTAPIRAPTTTTMRTAS